MTLEQPSVGTGVPKDAPEIKSQELELKLLVKSKETITTNKKNIKEMVSWRDFTLINLDNSNAFTILDEKAKILDLSKVPKIRNFTMQDIFSQKGINRPPAGYSYYSYERDGVQLTPELKKLGLSIAPDWKTNSVLPESSKEVKYDLDKDNFFELADGKYVLFYNKDDFFQVFQTIDDRNIVLPPEEWKLVSAANMDKTPEEVKKYISFLKTISGSGIKELNEKYLLLQNDAGINILDKSNMDGPVLFSENLPSVGSNVAVDPTNKETVYFCQEESPDRIGEINMSGDRSTWKVRYARFQKQYENLRNLQLDPTGTFFLFYSGSELVMVTRDTLEEVKREEGLSNVSFDSLGRIRAIDKDGYFNVFEVDYATLSGSMAKRKAEALASGIDIKSIFEQKKTNDQNYDQKTIENLEPIKQDWEAEILPKISGVSTMEEALSLRNNLNILRQTLRSQNIGPDQIKFITEGIEKAINDKEKEYAGIEAEKYFIEIETKLAGPLSISSINELRSVLDKIKPIEGALEINEREKARKLSEEVNKRAIELFTREGSKVTEELNNLMEGTKKQLDGLVNKNEFDDWMEFRFPQLKARLGMLLQDCPIEAFEAASAITNARNNLVQIADKYSHKFELEYAQVREQAVERTDTVVQTLKDDINALTSRVASKQFKSREEAEQYLNTSEAKRVLEEEIQELAKNNPEAAKELERGLKVTVANSLGYIERGGSNVIAETGQQMVMFGEVPFPRFEGKVKEKQKVNVDVTFVLDESSKGPGVSPNNFYGDVKLVVTNNKGEKRIMRLYEALGNEDEWRLGLLSYRGDAIPPSYLTAENFKTIKKNLNDWERGDLKEKDNQYRTDISNLFATREKIGKRDPETDEKWQISYKEKIAEYGKFCSENHILFFRRMEMVKNENSIDENGKGYVPKWQNHWVNDPTTEGYLEQMAKHFKMQGDLQEGILNLYGHAGTGKDVLIKMFASKEKANRPYFAVDCTKWTTEYELSEDVVLEAKDGATQTVRVPSSVLTGIQTPGGLVYFNEINGMPEQAQIFLHALFDEKRAMTLKTSSGKVVQALPSVLFACSMNPNYPGTFEPQFATKSRMVSMEIDYPPLNRKIKDGEPQGREEPYNSSEALRIARGTESLVDFTYELNMDKNEFVKIWDKNVNGINNEAPNINKSQEFDLNVIKALIQFANKLRQDFKKNFEKTSEKRDALPVFQPITLREMRRCAYALSKMPESEKINGDSDKIARDLLKNFFLSNIYKTDDRKKIEDALKVMNSKNRVL